MQVERSALGACHLWFGARAARAFGASFQLLHSPQSAVTRGLPPEDLGARHSWQELKPMEAVGFPTGPATWRASVQCVRLLEVPGPPRSRALLGLYQELVPHELSSQPRF